MDAATFSEIEGMQHSILKWHVSASRFRFDNMRPEDTGGELLLQQRIFSSSVFRSKALSYTSTVRYTVKPFRIEALTHAPINDFCGRPAFRKSPSIKMTMRWPLPYNRAT